MLAYNLPIKKNHISSVLWKKLQKKKMKKKSMYECVCKNEDKKKIYIWKNVCCVE